MKTFAFGLLLVLAGIAHVHGGGYVLKGGVVDFGKPLDYFDVAVQAGKMAWSKKLEEEIQSEQADRGVRHINYVPTFFTSQENHAALQATRENVPQQLRTVRETYNPHPIYYNIYPNAR